MAVARIWKYGRCFTTEDPVEVELACYKATRAAVEWQRDNPGEKLPPEMQAQVKGLLPAEEHLLLCATLALPEKIFRPSPWTRRRFHAFVHHLWHTELGAGGCGKSTDIGAALYFDFCAHRDNTTVKVYSTTKDSLRKRIWKDIVKFHQAYPADLCYTPSTFQITYGKGDTINGIFGLGVLRDNGDVAISNLIGVHNTRNICVADELQGTPEEVIAQTANQRIGGMFQFIGLGNPYDFTDTLCKNSVPWDGGWEKLPADAEEWVTRVGVSKKGYALRFDGEKSPRITEPNGEKLYPFLIGRRDIDDLKDQFGEDSAEYWTQARGRPKLRGSYTTFLDPALVDEKDMCGRFVFVEPPTTFGALDPAFTTGGDRPFLSFAKVGRTNLGLVGIQFTDEVSLKIEPRPGESVTDFLVRRVAEECARRRCIGRNFGMDTTGQETLADVISARIGAGVNRESFAAAASDDQVSVKDKRKGKKAFKDRVTELWHLVSLYGREGHIRGLSPAAVTEFTARKWILLPDGRRQAQKKAIVRAVLGRSPDNADSKSILLATVRKRLGLIPGSRLSGANLSDERRKKLALDFQKFLPHNARSKVKALPFTTHALH